MNKKAFFSLILASLLATSLLAMSGPLPPPTLIELQGKLSAQLTTLDAALSQAAATLSVTGLTGLGAGRELDYIYQQFPFVVDVVTISNDGILVLIEPEKYQYSIGENISTQAHFIKIKAIGQPVLSRSFKTVEGFWAVTLARPVTREGQVIGYVSAVFKPDALVRNVLKDHDLTNDIELMLVQLDGKLIYDRDILQVGKETFSDPGYKNAPSLLALANRITGEVGGSGDYEFMSRKYLAEWATVSTYGTDWRIIVSREQP